MERRDELMAAAATKFGLLERNKVQTHFSEHSLVRSYRLGAETVYVRMTDEAHKPYAKIAGEVQWVGFLGSTGVCVSRPLFSVDGNLAERIRVENREYTACVTRKPRGVRSERTMPMRAYTGEWANTWVACTALPRARHKTARLVG